jgi:preprotein translocase subunit SecE
MQRIEELYRRIPRKPLIAYSFMVIVMALALVGVQQNFQAIDHERMVREKAVDTVLTVGCARDNTFARALHGIYTAGLKVSESLPKTPERVAFIEETKRELKLIVQFDCKKLIARIPK